jgi:hypothetical protein
MTVTGTSGNFGTTGPVCVTFHGNVNGWNASNVTARTVIVTGSTTQMPAVTGGSIPNQPSLTASSDGYIYWNYTGGAGAFTYAAMDIW